MGEKSERSRLGRSVEYQSRGSTVFREVLVLREVCDSCWNLLEKDRKSETYLCCENLWSS